MKETNINTDSSKLNSRINMESKNAKPDNTQSGKTEYNNQESANNKTKHKDNTKLDSNGDEIMYEIWHNLTWWDYIMYSIILFLGIAMLYGGIELLIFSIPTTLIAI